MANANNVSVTEKLTLTTEQREELEALFVKDPNALLKRVKGVMRYHTYTVDQLIAAMHESADRDEVPLVIESDDRSTISRALAVARAWRNSDAEILIPEGSAGRDQNLKDLAQIANINRGGLSRYEIAEDERLEDGDRYLPVTIKPKASESFEPFDVEVPWGCGQNAIADIVEAFLTERLMGEDEGDDWLSAYRRAVVYANNEKRRLGQAHNSTAADSRVGDQGAEQSNDKGRKAKKTGARNQGGTGGKKGAKQDEPQSEPAKPSAPKTRGQKTLDEATTEDLIRALTLRISDYSVPLTVKDTQAWSTMEEHYETRFEKLPVGATVKATPKATAKEVEKAQDKAVADAQEKIQKAPAPKGTKDQMDRAMIAEMVAMGLSEKKARKILAKAK